MGYTLPPGSTTAISPSNGGENTYGNGISTPDGTRVTCYRESQVGMPGESPHEAVTADSSSGSQRSVWVPWALPSNAQAAAGASLAPFSPWGRVQAAYDFLGWESYVPPTFFHGVMLTPGYIARQIPDAHPSWLPNSSMPSYDDVTYSPLMLADRVQDIRGMAGAGKDASGVSGYDEARLTVGYRNYPFRAISDARLMAITGQSFPDESSLLRYVSIKQTTVSRYQTVPRLTAPLFWVGTQNAVVSEAVVILPQYEILIKWFFVPINAVPWNALQGTAAVGGCQGCTNVNPFGHPKSMIQQKAAATVVFVGWDYEVVQRPLGYWAFNMTYKFRYYPFGANAFYWWGGMAGVVGPNTAPLDNTAAPAGSPGYYLVTTDGAAPNAAGTNTLYRIRDLNALFRGGP